MTVLGIADSINSGAAVIKGGRIDTAINEERLDRNKMCMGFPRLSIEEVMRVADISPNDVDAVAVATNMLFWRPECLPYTDYFRENRGGWMRETLLSMGGTFSALMGNSSFARNTYHTLKSLLTQNRRRKIRKVLADDFGVNAPVRFVDHHLSHAASAYFTSGFERATVITLDGAGDAKCSRVYRVQQGGFEELQNLDSYHSIGNYYSYVTHLCGFKGHKHEGKITGLAAHGEPAYLDMFRRYVDWDGESIRNIGKCFDHSAIDKLRRDLPEDFSREDLSASVQTLLEKAVSAYADYWVRESGISNVALAGGVFANVKLNQYVHELDSVENVFVHPGMGDDGLAAGAALFEHNRQEGYTPNSVMGDVYLGPRQLEDEIQEAIRGYDVHVVERSEPLESKVARMLADGKVIARSAGRMEYGPRALGNRTIMYKTTDPTVNRWLNERLDRTEFMPFAPVTLWEDRHDCYKNISGAEETARFMTITFDCTEEMKDRSPAVVHIDGTARPQLIKEEENPSYYQILNEYKQITGIPSLINTSFNMHEEPIVNTPQEAVKAFLSTELDALVLGDHLLVSDHESAVAEGREASSRSRGR
ncbi:carbamoyltransferase [Salinibacter ruber]|uniref:carbamoyltransferase family protein n=1 Tax=Salinibacter ruber TaxID=146919 RepID=UPI002167B652|nr:carbamoyltransferase C-terminal domain-containing protein [Salinibacter ruber]MCS3700162.1 carbamoyltransferase [Salinibacter ruber]